MIDFSQPANRPPRGPRRATTWMHTIFGVLITLSLWAATPGVATADSYYTRPASQDHIVSYVIARAVAQRGVPFTYGGGDTTGPTRGIAEPETPEETDPDASALGSDRTEGIVELGRRDATAAVDEPDNVVGFDASGLMVYSFAGAGLKLPRSSGEQYKIGRKIPPALALPGDLIFYGPEGSDSVALFLGNRRMLEVGERGVVVSPVRTDDMTPYLARYIG